MITYNICLIKRGQEVLLLNREKPSWMGCWNGVGGKIEKTETPRQSMIRELYEETGIKDCDVQFKGFTTWTSDGSNFGGMYMYVVEMPEDFEYITPIKTSEGILDWKKIDWIMNPKNVGVAFSIPKTLEALLYDSHCYEFHCVYDKGVLLDFKSTQIPSAMETNETMCEQYFNKYYVV